MKKIVAFIGSDRRGGTFEAVKILKEEIQKLSDVDFEIVFMKEFNLNFCCGCKICFDDGEDKCPFKDDRDLILTKFEEADGVIFGVPNYAYQLSARTKNVLDRVAFIIHRPSFFNKSFTTIISQGVFGGRKIGKYLESTFDLLGFESVEGICITTIEPMTVKQKDKNKGKIIKLAKRYNSHLNKKRPLKPTLYRIMMFRMSRTIIKNLEESYFDYKYFKQKGWFEADYYYDVKLGFLKKKFGKLFDFLGRIVT